MIARPPFLFGGTGMRTLGVLVAVAQTTFSALVKILVRELRTTEQTNVSLPAWVPARSCHNPLSNNDSCILNAAAPSRAAALALTMTSRCCRPSCSTWVSFPALAPPSAAQSAASWCLQTCPPSLRCLAQVRFFCLCNKVVGISIAGRHACLPCTVWHRRGRLSLAQSHSPPIFRCMELLVWSRQQSGQNQEQNQDQNAQAKQSTGQP